MTIKELKEFIKDLPDDMEVMTADSEWGTEDSNLDIAEMKRYTSGPENITITYLRIS